MNAANPGFGIYIHWPYCKAKCPYCDFNSHVRQDVNALAFADALCQELAFMREMSGPRELTSVFFGGGTPSLMPPKAVDQILRQIDKFWSIPDLTEISLEANPTSIEADNFRGYRSAGVNRVSVGVQALNDADLMRLGRQHSTDEALAAFRLAHNIFERVSFDLIYARPAQTLKQWESELARAIAEQAGHMSLYQLTIEEGTAYFDLHEHGKLQLPSEDESAAFFDLTQAMTMDAGLRAYEVSNHAFPGQESRHNLLYWRYGEYGCVGPGAHGRLVINETRHALSAIRDPELWQKAVLEKGHGISEMQPLAASDQAFEYLIMGMRLTEGISRSRYHHLSGSPLNADRISSLQDQGLIQCGQDNITATPQGRRILNAVIAKLAGL